MKAHSSGLGLLGLSTLYQAGNCTNTTSSFASQCSALATSLSLPNTTVWFTEFVAAGTILELPDNDPTCGIPSQLVSTDTCRVVMRVATSNASEISLEAWLPSPGAWTGRFLSAGNGGLAGCVGYADIAYAAALGFAAVGANNGHNGTSGAPFYNAPEVVTDFAWRSVHTGVVVGKEVTAQFYGRTHDKSYYLGCSTGGRQGFKSAQSFPEDFDGIVAGAPAIDFNNLNSWSGHFYLLTGDADSDTYLSPDLWEVVHKDVLAQCDALDGVADGILEDPDLCDYRPENLICTSNSSGISSCLTGTQAATVRAVFSGLYGVNGTLVYPRMQPGSEESARYVYYNGTAAQYTKDWYRYVIYNKPDWDPATLSPADYAVAAAKNPSNIQTWEGDLSKVRDRGAKILHYHGLMDAVISSDNSPRYYNHVSRTMGLPSSKLDDFYRFFRISGMGHCSGGNGASFIGNRAATNATIDPDGNVLMAIVRWVEEGVAPEYIEGTAYVNGTKDSGEVLFKRRHCKYPARNVYVGTGDGTDEDGWECV